jgi:hypothetical protein
MRERGCQAARPTPRAGGCCLEPGILLATVPAHRIRSSVKVSTGACAVHRAKVGLWRAELADRRRGIRAYWNSTCRPIVSTATTTMASSGTPSPAIAPPVEARDAGTSRRAGAESSRLSGQDDLDHRAAAGVVIDVPGFAGWVLSEFSDRAKTSALPAVIGTEATWTKPRAGSSLLKASTTLLIL